MIHRRQALAYALALPLAAALPAAARAGDKTYNTGGIAIHGYDPVAYFTEGAPVQGSRDHALMWKGAVWYFASAANMAAFEADPRAYAPQYGGYCAYAAAHGQRAPSTPEAFTIVGGKLYLNLSEEVRSLWRADAAKHIAAADAAWAKMRK